MSFKINNNLIIFIDNYQLLSLLESLVENFGKDHLKYLS